MSQSSPSNSILSNVDCEPDSLKLKFESVGILYVDFLNPKWTTKYFDSGISGEVNAYQ